jgi:hypothetical protein
MLKISLKKPNSPTQPANAILTSQRHLLRQRSYSAHSSKKTAEACGIKVEGKNKWKTLIENASRNSKSS